MHPIHKKATRRYVPPTQVVEATMAGDKEYRQPEIAARGIRGMKVRCQDASGPGQQAHGTEPPKK